MSKVKIVATIGPSCESPAMIEEMVEAGVNAFRLNTAYRELDYWETICGRIGRIGKVPVIVDLKGTDVRLQMDAPREMERGETLEVGFREGPCHFNKDFRGSLSVEDTVFFQDGLIETEVTSKTGDTVTLEFLHPALVESGSGVNVPKDLSLEPLLSERDRAILRVAEGHDAEFVALSFTKTADDVRALRETLMDDSTGVIAKIESVQGVRNVDAILEVSDGIMVARGDLGVELPQEKVPMIQKQLIRTANEHGKIVITATEMLQSMVENPRPTRAETSDVANAVLDGTDAVMLSAETAVGEYPVEAVREMGAIAREAEPFVETTVTRKSDAISEIIINAVRELPDHVDRIITVTRSGFTARMIAGLRNRQEIVAVTRDAKVKRRLELVYGVRPLHHPRLPETEQMLNAARFAHAEGMVGETDTVLITSGALTKKHGTNAVTIVRMDEIL